MPRFPVANSNESSEYDCLLKVVVLGDAASRKTSFIKKLRWGNSCPPDRTTIGVEFENYSISVPGTGAVELQIWDTTGQERYRAILSPYISGTDIIPILCALDNRGSFESIERWFKAANDHGDSNLVVILIGTYSSDESSELLVSQQEFKEYASRLVGQDRVYMIDLANDDAHFIINKIFHNAAKAILAAYSYSDGVTDESLIEEVASSDGSNATGVASSEPPSYTVLPTQDHDWAPTYTQAIRTVGVLGLPQREQRGAVRAVEISPPRAQLPFCRIS